MRLLFFLLFCQLSFVASLAAQGLFDPATISDIRIVFETKDWDRHLDSLKQNGLKGGLTAQVTLNGKIYKGCNVRYKGNSSYFNVRNAKMAKLPFTIRAPKDQLFDDRFEVLKLSNNFRDPSQIRDVLGYEIARKYMHASLSSFAHLYVDGQDFGLYTNTEPVEKAQVETWTGVKNGTLVKCDPDWNVAEVPSCIQGSFASLTYLGDDPKCYAPLYELEMGTSLQPIITLSKKLNKEPLKIANHLAVDETLWMLAFNHITLNLDSYLGKLSHNYYLYCDSQGVCMPILWDLNLSFGGFQYDGATPTALSMEQLAKLSPFLHYDNPKRPLVNVLLKDPLYRKMYIAHLHTMLDEIMKAGVFEQQINTHSQKIASLLAQDKLALYGEEAFRKNKSEAVTIGKTEIPGLLPLLKAHSEYLNQHPALLKKGPTFAQNPKHQIMGSLVAISTNSLDATAAHVFYRKKGSLAWSKSDMENLAGTWVAELPFIAGMQYFVVLENEEAAVCYPRRTSKEAIRVE